MRLLGLTITREKAAGSLTPADTRGGWWPAIKESFTGAWQKNVEVRPESVLAFHAVFACQTLIASDIAKLRVKLVARDGSGIWSEVKNPAYSPVLRKPNAYQNRIQFFESWVLSKLRRGNTYGLKVRDARNVVIALHVLDPDRVKPLVASNGDVFYQLSADPLAGLEEAVVVPAREIVHDRFNCMFHPLVGLSPIYANGLAATQGIAIQNSSARLFQNGGRPGGILIAPGAISDETAKRLKEHWDNNYTGENAGKVAVLGDSLKYESLSQNAKDTQLIEQLKWSAEVVCSTYHVPPYKIGVGQMPAYTNVQALNLEYYSQCLQSHIEALELCLDEGLATGEDLGTEFDTDNLLRMDSVTQMDVIERSKNVLTLDERRRKLDAPKIAGGDTVYLQQQDHSIQAIAARDQQLIDQTTNPPVPAPTEPTGAANDNAEAEAERRQAERAHLALFQKELREALNG